MPLSSAARCSFPRHRRKFVIAGTLAFILERIIEPVYHISLPCTGIAHS